MVIYDSGDSDLLIQSLSENLGSATAIFEKVNQGTQHLNSVIDSGTLSGAAYRAGQSLFQTYISPMIQKLASAITDIKGDLDSYKSAEQEVRYLSSHLDEAQLNKKLENTNRLIDLIEQKIAEDRRLIQKFMSSGFEGVANGLAELPGLDRQLDNLKHLRHDYEKKLQALQTFSSTTSSLFTDSLQAFKYALQGVELINQSTSSNDGTISFPAGADMSWLTKLQGEKFSSKLTKEPKIEIRTREGKKEANGMYPDAAYMTETIYEIYVDGVLDKEKTNSFNWMRKNKEFMDNLHTMGDFVFFNDIYSLATGKDWLSGNKKNKLESAAWLALAALPVSKLSKIAKELKAGNKLLKGVDLTAKDLRILQGAGYFGEAATKRVVKMPAAHLEVVERFKEPAISNYANRITGEYTQKDITKLAELTTHNAKSDTAILGYFEPNSVMSYEQIGYENGLTYFDAGNNGWDAMSKANEHLAPAVNEEFLYKQISEGKEFVLSSNPYKAKEIYEKTSKGQSYLEELRILNDKGYKIEKYGELWKAVKK